jgi:anti-sigma regulatory factor (Ser/Thr protein kinase)
VSAASRTFPAEAASVPVARHYVQATLRDLGLSAAWDAAELLVSEVATNAVLHARTEFMIEVLGGGDMVRISVHDRSPTVPTQRTYGTDATTGRGMRLVATLAVAWGVDRHDGGKAVWFEVSATGARDGLAEPWGDEADVHALLAAFDDLDGLAPRASTGQVHRWPDGRSLGLAA